MTPQAFVEKWRFFILATQRTNKAADEKIAEMTADLDALLAAERERCAMVAEHHSDWRNEHAFNPENDSAAGHRERLNECELIAAAIRADRPTP